ncbi:MAG: hypothetical protein Q9223_005994 [Gallowayella weberi]
MLQKIEQCVQRPQEHPYHEDVMAQGVIINAAYDSFEKYLIKRKDLASQSHSKIDKLRCLAQVVLTGLDELHGKVEKLQIRVVNAMAFIGPILAFEISFKVTTLEEGLQDNNAYQGQITELLYSIQVQTNSLRVMSSDYKDQLTSTMTEGRQDRGREMEKIQDNVKSIEKSRERLTGSLTVLTRKIHEQHQQSESMSAANAEIWARLSTDAATQSQSLHNVRDSTAETITHTGTVLEGVAHVSGDDRFADASRKLGGINTIYRLAVGWISSIRTEASGTTGDSSVQIRNPGSETKHRPANKKSFDITSAPHSLEPNQAHHEVTRSRPIAGSPRLRLPPVGGVRNLVESDARDRSLRPPSRTGHRSFDNIRASSEPSQRPRTFNVSNESSAKTPPPLPPRKLDPSDPRSRSADHAQGQPVPLPKPPSLNLCIPTAKSRNPSPRSPSGSRDGGCVFIEVNSNLCSEVLPASSTILASPFQEYPAEESSSPTGALSSNTTNRALTDSEAGPTIQQA